MNYSSTSVPPDRGPSQEAVTVNWGVVSPTDVSQPTISYDTPEAAGPESDQASTSSQQRWSLGSSLADTYSHSRAPSITANSIVLSERTPEEESLTEAGDVPTVAVPEYSQARLPIRQSLGISGCLVIIGGALGSLAGLGFLIFLWTGYGTDHEGTHASSAWRAIILGGWITQATTLSVLLIRTTSAMQVTVCTAMLASLILEKRHVRKSQVVFYSVIRGINDGPRTLAELILRSKRDLVRIESLLTFLLTIISLALQFSSTIIFSDLQESLVVADPVHFPVTNHIAQRVDKLYGSSSPPPPVYAIYGEVPSNLTSLPDSRGFSDNGLRERALLPFKTAENRTAVRSYHGNAVVMSSRVACMRPQIKGIYSAAPQGYIDGALGTVDYGRMVGTVDYGSSLLNAHDNSALCVPGGCLNATFDCTIPGSPEGTPPDWKTSYCVAGGVGGSFWSPRGIIQWNKTDDPWTANNLVHLIFTTNMMAPEWASFNQSRAVPSPTDSSYGEWNSIQIMPGRFLNISVCFSALNIRLSSVSMVAAGNLEEPRGNSTITGPGDSSPVRTFLGMNSTKQSHKERGILTVQDVEEPAILSAVDPYKRGSGWTLAQISTGYFEWNVYQKLFRSDRNEAADDGQKAAFSWRGCVICSFYGSAEHDEVALLWEDTIKSTSRAAEAMQAYMTVLALTKYNEFLKAFTGTEDAEIAFTRRVRTAARCGENGCKGLATVAALVGSYLVCVLLVTVIYVYQIRLSRQGNVWHTVAQLAGDELMETLKEGNFVDDDALKRSLRKGGKDSLVKLGRSKCGMVHVVKCNEGI